MANQGCPFVGMYAKKINEFVKTFFLFFYFILLRYITYRTTYYIALLTILLMTLRYLQYYL